MLDLQRGLRGLAILTLAVAVASCGGGGGNDNNTSDDGSPPPGTFVGTLAIGGAVSLQVGGIEEIAFDCAGVAIQESFSPPQPIGADRSFHVSFSDGGRKFDVEGTFADDDHVSGTIDDHDDHCDSSFAATRSTLPVTPTHVVTPTPSGPVTESSTTPTPTETATGPTLTPTSTSSGPINTTGTPTMTPTPTPTPTTPTVEPTNRCPNAVEVIGTAGTQKVLDTGWTGLAHDQTVIQDGKITFSLSGCANSSPPCGVCQVGGPIPNVKADQGDINDHRCSNDTSIKCTDDTACTSPGKCAFFFGAPLPLSAGGVSTCVTNQVNGSASGTTNIESGAFATTLNLNSRVYNAIVLDQPCPVCAGDGTVNDGTKGGTCNGGPRNGQPCDGNGHSAVPSFGTTSFDCPPNPGALITTLSIALDGSSGTETMTLSSTSPPCSAAPGKKCFCPSDGQVTQPNACLDDTSTPNVDESQCSADSQTKGHCAGGPVDTVCRIETFRGCLQNTDCPAQGDSCGSQNRPCYLDNGTVGGSVTAIGMADPPDANGESDPTFAALFCVGKTNAAVNAAAGLPGLGRIQLPLHSKQFTTH